MQERVPAAFAVIQECAWGVYNVTQDTHGDWTPQYFYFIGAWLSAFFWHAWYFSATLEI